MSPNAAGSERPPVMPPYRRLLFISICCAEPESFTDIAGLPEVPYSEKECAPSGVRSLRNTKATQYAPGPGTVNCKVFPRASISSVSWRPTANSADQMRHAVQGLAVRAVAIWENVLVAARPRGADAPPPLAFRGAGGGGAAATGRKPVAARRSPR